jgi:hypothetical protein
MVNLKLIPYLMSKFVVLGGFSFIQGLALLVVIALGVRLPDHALLLPAPIEIYITLLLTIWAAISMGLWISSFADSNSAVYIILPILIVHIIFAGAFFDLNEVTEIISYGTITRWSLNNMGASARLNILNELHLSRVRPDIKKEVSLTQDGVPELGETRTITYTVPMTGDPISCNCAITDTAQLPEIPSLPPEQSATCICITTEMTETSKTITETVSFTDPLDSQSKFDFQLGFECTDAVREMDQDGNERQAIVLDEDCTKIRLFENWGILFGFTAGFQVLSVITLKLKERGSR